LRTGTGASSSPWSFPITQNRIRLPKNRFHVLNEAALIARNRYSPRATGSCGHTTPFTTPTSPTAPPSHEPGGTTAVERRLWRPSGANNFSCSTRGISNSPAGSPSGLSGAPVSNSSRSSIMPVNPAYTFARVIPIAWSWYQR
jgi:hypothetical protein